MKLDSIPHLEINRELEKIIRKINPKIVYTTPNHDINKDHQKVFESKDMESGITIHFVNEIYDDGAIIFQAKCPLHSKIKTKGIQKKVHELEMKFFPRIIENLLDGKN